MMSVAMSTADQRPTILRMREAAPSGRDLQAERWHGEVAARLFGRPPSSPSVGRYRLVARLGAGASGEVWSADDPQLDRRVAIKILHPELGSATNHAAMVREAKALAKLSHPNVVPVFDAGIHEGRVFVTLELVEGTNARAWLATPRAWPEVVEVFVQVARGLAAAHAAGIVHRDVKPENILVGADGRVRISDFGIARAPGTGESDGDEPNDGTASAGAGTPAYMAPEQLLGDPLDGRTDQFGLCVALHEALWRERPFQGRDRAALAANIIAGRRRTPRAEIDVPRWLDRLVARGLATDPSQRFADLEALIHELVRPRDRRLTPWLAVAAIAAAGLGLHLATAPTTTTTCNDGADRLAAHWNLEAAAKIRGAFAATAVPHAEARAEGLVAELDRFGEAWTTAHARVCEAELDEDVRIAQQYCLETRLIELGSMATAFASADAAVVEHAARGGSTLRSPGDCLYIVPAPMAAPQQLEQHLALRVAIAQARAHGDVGRLEMGLTVAREATATARELGNRSLEAEALLVEAELLNPLLGTRAQADPTDTVHAAVLAAEAAHRADLIALATVASMEAQLARGDAARVRQLEPRARASAAALGDPPELVGRIDLCQAWLLELNHEEADGRALLEHAREQFERSGPTSRRWLAQALNMLGESHFRRGAYAKARPYYERALAIVREDLRDHHLLVASASGNLAETYFLAGDFATATELFERALTIRREVFGDGSIWVTHTQGHLGDCALELGHTLRAREWYAEALITRSMQAPLASDAAVADVMRDLQTHLQATWMHNGLALTFVELGRYEEALLHAEQADTAALPADIHHPDLAARIDTRGVALLAMGRVDEAIAELEHALERFGAAYPDDARAIAFTLVGLGRARLAQGDADGAIAPLQRALEIFAPTPRAHPRTQAAARFALAQAWQHDAAQRNRGREQVRAAIELLEGAKGLALIERETMQDWLEAFGP